MQYLNRFQRPLHALTTCLIPHKNVFNINRFSFSSSIDQDELLQQLQTHNNDRKNKSSQTSNPTHVEHLMNQIRLLHAERDTETISLDLALNSCFFVTHYHTDKALSLPPDNVDQFMKFQENHHSDMSMAWNLLDTPSDTANTFDPNRACWKIEMATRLEDTYKIYKSFMELYNAKQQNFENFDNDQLMIGFSAIPYIGQWSLMLQLAEIIKNKIPDAFTSLYNMAQTLPIPDFTMIYDIITTNERLFLENEIQIQDIEQITDDSFDWNMYEFESVKLRFKDLHCYESMEDMNRNKEKENQILDSMGNDMKEWKTVDLGDDEETNEQGCNLKKSGCIAQAKSFYAYGDMIAIQLYGPWVKNGIKVKGRVDVPIYGQNKQNENENEKNENENDENDTPVIVIVHEEEWDLKQDQDNEKLFNGIYIVRQRNDILDKENIQHDSEQMKNFGPMDWIYDLQITIK